jgi:hypothetical protein
MGGDGTLSAWIDNLVSEIMRQGDVASVEKAMEKLPVIGYGETVILNFSAHE